jgi:Lipocalin-like domain
MAAQKAAPRDLVGTWTLSSIESLGTGSTPPATLPLPRGLLVFDAAGHAFELAKSGRYVANTANQATPAEAQALFASFGGFWGNYKVDEAQKKITYRPEGAINPNAMGQDLVRSYELTGDRLVVTSVAGSIDGHDVMRWTWDRVPELENLTAANRRLIGFWQHVVERRINATTGAVLSETHRAPSIIVYTPSGYVGVHFPPMNRQRFTGAMPTDDEARAAIAGFVSYYGSYTLHPGIVFHHRLIILANGQGDSLKRFYEITNDEINLTFPTVINQGQDVRTVVTLRRLSGEADMLGSR